MFFIYLRNSILSVVLGFGLFESAHAEKLKDLMKLWNEMRENYPHYIESHTFFQEDDVSGLGPRYPFIMIESKNIAPTTLKEISRKTVKELEDKITEIWKEKKLFYPLDQKHTDSTHSPSHRSQASQTDGNIDTQELERVQNDLSVLNLRLPD